MLDPDIYISDEDNSEIDIFVQLSEVEGGKELVDEIIKESLTDARSHAIDTTITRINEDYYEQLEEE